MDANWIWLVREQNLKNAISIWTSGRVLVKVAFLWRPESVIITRSSPQWWSGRSTITHIVFRSAFTHLGLWQKLYDCSLQHFSQPMGPKMCSIDIWVDLQLVGWNLKGRLFTIPSLGSRLSETWGSGISSFNSSPTGSYLLPIDTNGPSATVFELFSWPKKRFRPSDPDTALEATVLSSDSKVQMINLSPPAPVCLLTELTSQDTVASLAIEIATSVCCLLRRL